MTWNANAFDSTKYLLAEFHSAKGVKNKVCKIAFVIELCPSLPCLKLAVPTLLSSGTIPKASEFPELGELQPKSKPSPGMFQPVSTSQLCFPKTSWASNLDAPETPKRFRITRFRDNNFGDRSCQGALVVNSQLELGKAGTPTYRSFFQQN